MRRVADVHKLRAPSLPARALVLALFVFGVACGDSGGGDAQSSNDEASATADTSDNEGVAEEQVPAATELDVEIARVVQVRGQDLYLTSNFFGDIDFDGVKKVGVEPLNFFASVRLKIARRMEKKASSAVDALAEIAPQATTATEVAEEGHASFVAFEKCASKAAAFWTGVIDGSASFKDMVKADGACDAARSAQKEAEAAVEELPEAAKKSTTGEAVAGGETAKVVVGIQDPSHPQEQEVVQPVAPGSKVNIVVDAKNESGFDWDLKKGCKGPLTFDVTLIVGSDGTEAIDPSEAGYSSGTREGAEASIKGSERFEVDVGTFTVADDASGSTTVSVSFSNNLCPDPVGGSLYSPIALGAGITHPVILEVGG
jgi:hypothetical protein